MFAVIETNGASHIAINIPHEGSEKSLPALARMLEQNAVFIKKGYQEVSVVAPVMSITLGNSFVVDNSDDVLVVKESGAVIGDDFVNHTPEVAVSNSKALKREKDEISRLRTELSYTKQQLAVALEAAASKDNDHV